MRSASLSGLTAGLFFFSVSAWSQANSCDLNADGKVDSTDVQAAITMSLGTAPCTANIAGANVCNVVVVQRVINASLPGGTCNTSIGMHSVSLTWTASTSSGVTAYKVYRAAKSGGPYTLLSTLGVATSYTDNSVASGLTYYYVVTAVDSNNNQSSNSNEAPTVIPVP